MSGQLRVRYGIAYGRENNFYTGVGGQKGYLAGTDGLFGQGATTPDVTLGTLFYSNNSGATTITDLKLSHPANGNVAGLFEGKRVQIWFLDNNTRFAFSSSGPLVGGTDGLQGANSYSEFQYHTSAWYLVDSSRPSNPMVQFTSSNVVYGTQSSLNVQGRTTVLLLNAANSNLTFTTLTGGEQGQEVCLYAAGSALQFVANTGGLPNSLITTSTTGSAVVLGSAQTMSFRFIGQYWVESR